MTHFKGVIAYVRVIEGKITKGDKISLLFKGTWVKSYLVGYFSPEPKEKESLEKAGEIALDRYWLKRAGLDQGR